MSFKKSLEESDKSKSSFQVHKKFKFTEADSGSGVFAIPIVQGTDSNLYNFSTDTADSKTVSDSVFYKTPNYGMINNLYYKDIRNMAGYIDLIRGVPTSSNAIVEYDSENVLDNTKKVLRRPHTRQLGSSATVISLPQQFYGENIKPFSVLVTDNSTDTTLLLRDDGRGNLYDVAFSASYASRSPIAEGSGSLVGNVFYNDGFIVITETNSPYNTVGTLEGNDGFSVEFKSTKTIYEREYVCAIDENEFQFTNNKSARVGRSGSLQISYDTLAGLATSITGTASTSSLSTSYPRVDYATLGYSTSSYDRGGYNIGKEFIGETTHSEFATYVTSVGLYNDENELLAIGKPASPIKNEKDLSLTFVVRFDTN
tara:strand:- start:250 stop:1359 length:1110 start_codon:yes stop_codon:yes gene_type:complete